MYYRLSKLIEYDDKLNFINEYKVPISFNCFTEIDDETFLIETSSSEEYFINFCDKSFHVKKQLIQRPKSQLNYSFSIVFPFKIRQDGTLDYHPSFSNTIYSFKDNSFTEKYFIIDEIGFPDEAFFNANKGVHPSRLLNKIKEEEFLTFLDFYEIDNYLLLKYYRGNEQNITVYNKELAKSSSYKTSSDSFISIILNNVLATDNGKFISYIFPYQCKNVDLQYYNIKLSNNI